MIINDKLQLGKETPIDFVAAMKSFFIADILGEDLPREKAEERKPQWIRHGKFAYHIIGKLFVFQSYQIVLNMV